MAWLRTNPQVEADVQRLNGYGEYAFAAKHALDQWKRTLPVQSPGNPQAIQQAALPNSQQPQGRGLDPTAGQAEQLAMAIQYGHRTGDKRAALSMVFPDFELQLPPHLQNQQ